MKYVYVATKGGEVFYFLGDSSAPVSMLALEKNGYVNNGSPLCFADDFDFEEAGFQFTLLPESKTVEFEGATYEAMRGWTCQDCAFDHDDEIGQSANRRRCLPCGADNRHSPAVYWVKVA